MRNLKHFILGFIIFITGGEKLFYNSDGDIVVIGGIKKRDLQNVNSNTPGISKVPVVGNLFKSKTKKDDLTELLIFIAPRVIE